jgi:hypothetical protein
MITGKEVHTPEAVYRLKLKGGEHLEMSAAWMFTPAAFFHLHRQFSPI